MRIGIFAKTFPGTVPMAAFAAAAQAGFDGVHYNMACSGLASMPDEIGEDQAAAVARASEATGVAIEAVSGTYNMIHPDPAVRRAGHGRLEVLASACAGMGTRLITLCTGTRDAQDQWAPHPDNGSTAAWRDLLASFEIALATAERHDLLLGVEPELANVVNSAGAAQRLIADLKSDRIRIILDPANLFERADAEERRRLVDEAVGLLCDRIVMAHAKDRDATGAFVAAGAGVIDFGHFLGRLRAEGFNGPIVAHGLAAEEAAGVAAFLRRELGKVWW